MSPMTRRFVAQLENFVSERQIPLVRFRKGQRKDKVMAEHLRRFTAEEGIVFGARPRRTPRSFARSGAAVHEAVSLIRGSSDAVPW